MKLFLGFILISGAGWIFDIISFTAMSQIFEIRAGYANFISSLVGVTFVWYVALNKIFNRSEYRKSIYLLIYWGYQYVSIFTYSLLISIVATSTINYRISEMIGIPLDLVAKILITAPNLLSNFIFMKILSGAMKPNNQG